MKIEPYFISIRENILATLVKAENSISVAVCWFINDELFNMLCTKLDQGLKLEVVILDDYINSNQYECNFQKFILKGGQLYLSSVDSPMHNKYCIVDEIILITALYNWTYFVESKNDENIVIFEEYKDLIVSFQADFERLKSKALRVDQFKQRNILNFESFEKDYSEGNAFGTTNVLSNEIFYKAVAQIMLNIMKPQKA